VSIVLDQMIVLARDKEDRALRADLRRGYSLWQRPLLARGHFMEMLTA
jgi:hypothetical protein